MKTLLGLFFAGIIAVVQGQSCTTYQAPKDFFFAAATAAYQVEGGAREDGKGASVWDIWTHYFPGVITDNSNGDIACDSYHKYDVDVQNLKKLGVQQYRFSISWPRILPDGTIKSLNLAGIRYYNNLINELKAAGIEPMATMFHFDTPTTLSDAGGWLSRDIVDKFGDYARVLYFFFGDRVKNWLTINEPLSISTWGYCGLTGVQAPGNFSMQCPWSKYLSAHYLILAHAKAYNIYKNEFKRFQHGKVGIVLSTGWYTPATNTNEDIAAANRARDFALGWFAEPIFFGDYPQSMKDGIASRSALEGYTTSRLPEFTEEEKEDLKGSADWLGINYYYGFSISNRVTFQYGLPQEQIDGATNRAVLYPYPQGLRSVLNYASQTYKVPVAVTENGYSDGTGTLDDTIRIAYLRDHLIATLQARQDGANVLGYTVWSLMDNMEWSSGYTVKYGLYQVNFTDPNRTRTPKASASWYTNVIAQHLNTASEGYTNSRLPEFTPLEKFLLKGSADWLGINYYYGFSISNRVTFPHGIPQEQVDGSTNRNVLYPFPQGLRSVLNYASQTYKVPVAVTENGYSDGTGTLDDTIRIAYLRDHLIATLQARQDGANVQGYTVWSLMDNMEWSSGYTVKYGFYQVNFTDPNRTRTPKASASWYTNVIAQRSINSC